MSSGCPLARNDVRDDAADANRIRTCALVLGEAANGFDRREQRRIRAGLRVAHERNEAADNDRENRKPEGSATHG